MIKLTSGNLLQAKTDALVNTVNTVGVMGKGIALQFKRAFPDNYVQYRAACKAGEVELGRVFVVDNGQLARPKFIINFPTKGHWRSKSKLADIEAGLTHLVQTVGELKLGSIAVPPLGCGYGGLAWSEVRPMIEGAFAALPDVEVYLYQPLGAPAPSEMPVRTERPGWTRARAVIVKLMEMYQVPDYRLSHLEVQKLAYFIQAAGEPMKLRYQADRFGPYADNLRHLLEKLEGHYTRGLGDHSGRAELHVLNGSAVEAASFLETEDSAVERLDEVRRLIEGFETPYGMEFLATVHWVMGDTGPRDDEDTAVAAVRAWSDRKRRRFEEHHIRTAWRHLRGLGWAERRVERR